MILVKKTNKKIKLTTRVRLQRLDQSHQMKPAIIKQYPENNNPTINYKILYREGGRTII